MGIDYIDYIDSINCVDCMGYTATICYHRIMKIRDELGVKNVARFIAWYESLLGYSSCSYYYYSYYCYFSLAFPCVSIFSLFFPSVDFELLRSNDRVTTAPRALLSSIVRSFRISTLL